MGQGLTNGVRTAAFVAALSMTRGVPLEAAPVSTADSCPANITFSVTAQRFATYLDPKTGVTEVYTREYQQNHIAVNRIDAALNRTTEILPLAPGVAVLAEDLDRDGNLDLCLQRSDGSSSFLDILAAPDWEPRGHIAFPGMNAEMWPIAVDIDGDSTLEIYTNPLSTFGPNARAVIIKYLTACDSFGVIADIQAPDYAGGPTAAADFDNDGRVEFITGGGGGYCLFEWRDSALSYVGQLANQPGGYCASACRPLPGGLTCAVLSSYRWVTPYTSGADVHSLIRAIGDNDFVEARLFQGSLGPYGPPATNFTCDYDCDGLDELMLTDYPHFRIWEWNNATDEFEETCVWDKDTYGNMYYDWSLVDLDQNGANELANVNTAKVFHAFPGPECVGCDLQGHCVPPPPVCACLCHADPSCDGILNIVDAVKVIDVAFRNAAQQNDPGPLCGAAQSDVDCSGSTDVLDVIRMINVAFRNIPANEQFCDPCGQ